MDEEHSKLSDLWPFSTLFLILWLKKSVWGVFPLRGQCNRPLLWLANIIANALINMMDSKNNKLNKVKILWLFIMNCHYSFKNSFYMKYVTYTLRRRCWVQNSWHGLIFGQKYFGKASIILRFVFKTVNGEMYWTHA